MNINTRDRIIILDFLDGRRDYVKYTRGARPFDLKVSNLKVRAKRTSQRARGLLFNLIKGPQSLPDISLTLFLLIYMSETGMQLLSRTPGLGGVRISGSRNYINFFPRYRLISRQRDFFLLTVYLGPDEVRQSGIIIIIRM